MRHYYITGGRQRLGLLMIKHLLARGHRVSTLNRQSSLELDILQQQYSTLHCYYGDVRHWSIHEILDKHPIDVVIHTASLFVEDDATSSDVHTREDMFDIHVHAFNTTVLTWYQRGGSGYAINFLDQKIHRLNPNHMSYTLSKMAAASNIPVLAQALLGNIRVHGIALGLTLPSGEQTIDEFQHACSTIPFSDGQIDSLLATLEYLTTTPSITGQIIDVDGGQHLMSDDDIIMKKTS